MSKEVDLNAIKDDAKHVADETETDFSEQLKDRLDKVDLLIGDLGQMSELIDAVRNYSEEASIETRWNRIARVCVMLGLGVIAAGLAITFMYVLINPTFGALRENPVAFSTISAVCVGGIIVLAITVTRAVFMSFADRNKDVPMPSHIEELVKSLTDFFKG